jgi:5-methylthioribose kinase
VDDGDRTFVVKRALAKLRVRDDWFADVSRGRSELTYLRHASAIVPGCTPRVLFAPPSGEWFALEYLGSEFARAGAVRWRDFPPLNAVGRILTINCRQRACSRSGRRPPAGSLPRHFLFARIRSGSSSIT